MNSRVASLATAGLVAVVGAHLGGAAGEAGPRRRRDRPRGTLGLLAESSAGSSAAVGSVVVFGGAEDLLGARAVEQGDELLGVDRLALEQDLASAIRARHAAR